jgi:hypothetical protein
MIQAYAWTCELQISKIQLNNSGSYRKSAISIGGKQCPLLWARKYRTIPSAPQQHSGRKITASLSYVTVRGEGKIKKGKREQDAKESV